MAKARMISQDTYKIKDNSIENLTKLGFKQSQYDSDTYEYTFVSQKMLSRPTLIGKITAYLDMKRIKLDLYDASGSPYAAFYGVDCGNHDELLKKVNTSFFNQFAKLNINKSVS